MFGTTRWLLAATIVGTSSWITSATSPVDPRVDPVEYVDPYDNGFPLKGFVSIPDAEEPAPAVVIIPDWTNVDEYEHMRATMLAEQFGWIGFAADIYGADFQGDLDADTRREQASKYRSNTTLFYGRIQAAVDVMAAHRLVMADKIAVIGYCFGGTGVLTYSFLGATDVVGAVSFHGGLAEFPVMDSIQHPILVLSGGDDDAGTEVEDLEERLVAANATWQITRYSGVEHAFTKWDDDRYNEVADDRSWREMATFLGEAFGLMSYGTIEPSTTEADSVEYEDSGFALTGYLALPDGALMNSTSAVVVLPDWDGASGSDGYEAKRATLLAQEGYVAFVADIYGSDLQQVESFQERAELANLYRTDHALFVSRIQAAVDLVAQHELVNPDEVLLIGYCFGGTGVVNYAFSGLRNVKAVVPFHGGLTSLAPVQTDSVYPYMLVQSGGTDDAHGNSTQLEMALDNANATWEISRYSNVNHGFTSWTSNAYDALADWRSWDAMLSVFDMILGHDKEEVTESNNSTGIGEDEDVLGSLASTITFESEAVYPPPSVVVDRTIAFP